MLPVGGVCWFGYEWAPDIDAYLVNPSGAVVAMSRCMLEATNDNCGAPGRFETLGVASAAAGTWKLRVESYSGAGSFDADVFGGLGTAPPPPPTPPAAPTGLPPADDDVHGSTWPGDAVTTRTASPCTAARASAARPSPRSRR